METREETGANTGVETGAETGVETGVETGGGEPSYAMPIGLFAMRVPTRVIEETATFDAVVFDRRSDLKGTVQT